MKLKQALAAKLTRQQLEQLKASHDIVGNIAILEMPPELEKKERVIAETLLALNKNIHTVVKKQGGHTGKYRIQRYRILAGKRCKETMHTELGVRVKLHLDKTYFSSRLSTERKRILLQIQPGEEVLVMFSGVGIYPIVFAKNSRAKHVTGIEMNPAAHAYAVENLKLNKVRNVKLMGGDVRNVMPRMKQTFDRICMPLPKGGENFLDLALKKIKPGGIIHFYDFLEEKEMPDAAFAKIQQACHKAKKVYDILNWNKCGSNAPRQYRICVDFRVG